MNEVKLIDFDLDQLQHILDEVVAGIHRLDSFDEIKSYKFYGCLEFASYDEQKTINRYLNLCLWKTQILTAIGFVTRRQQVNSN